MVQDVIVLMFAGQGRSGGGGTLAAVAKMTAGKPNTRRQGKKKARTMKTNRLIKMFTVG